MADSTRPSLMGIWAHPDDESFGMAGTMARSTNTGHPVAIVCATRGEEGQIADPSLATPENLGEVRTRELLAACAAVGVTDVSFLGYRDGHLPEADPAEAVGRIVYHIRRFRPDVVVTFAPNGAYGHVDHMAIHRLTLTAVRSAASEHEYASQVADGLHPHVVRKLYYVAIPRERLIRMRAEAQKQGQDFIPGGDAGTIPFDEMGTPMRDITTWVKLSDEEFEAKRRSMAAHATQMPADSPFARATPEQLREFLGTEVFQLVPSPVTDRTFTVPESDVFAGLE